MSSRRPFARTGSTPCIKEPATPSEDGCQSSPECSRKLKCAPRLDGRSSPFSNATKLPNIALPRKGANVETEEAGSDSMQLGKGIHTPGSRGSHLSMTSSHSSPSIMCAEGLTPCKNGSPLFTAVGVEVVPWGGEPQHAGQLPWPRSVGGSVQSKGRRAQKLDKTAVATLPVLRAPTPSTAASSNMGVPSGTTSSPHSSIVSVAPTPSSCSRGGLWWRRGEEIGCGAYGRVFLAQDKRDGQVFAVKSTKIRDAEDRKYAEKLQHELDVCKDLRHPNIASCLGSESFGHRLFIYLEYVPGGSLRRMVNNFGPLESPLLQKAIRGVSKGLNYLHTHDPPVVHRDLKGANVLVDLSFRAKLADFGCSKRDIKTQSFSQVGSILWMAPEMLMANGSGRAADIWSLGCLLLEVATAEDPWGKGFFDNIWQAMFVISKSDRYPAIPDTLPSDGVEFVEACLTRDAEDRPTITDLLEHRFLSRTSVGSRCTSRASLRSQSVREGPH